MDVHSKNIKTNLGAVSKIVQPFYAPPSYVQKTSAEIINEARAAIKVPSEELKDINFVEGMNMSDNSFAPALVKPINTQRPFTPKDKQRTLFGRKSKNPRPPSSFSLRYLQFENSECVPQSPKDTLTTKINRSNSITDINSEKIFNLNVKDVLTHKIKLPSLEPNVKAKKKLFQASSSLDNFIRPVPEEHELPASVYTEIKRNAFSSPKERTDFDNRSDTPFGRPSKQMLRNSESLILGPRNLDKIFENKQIVQDSETLFMNKAFWGNKTRHHENKHPVKQIFIDEKKPEPPSTEKQISDIITALNNASGKPDNDEKILHLLRQLYDYLDKNHLFGSKVNSKFKIQILKCLYKQVESQNEEILLQVAKIILELRVTGNNLSGVCKLVFKVSRNDKNDTLFLKDNILELFVDALGRSSPLDDAEACVYGYGAIKFLTMNSTLLEKILNLGILQLMVLHIKLVNITRKETSVVPEQTNHALYQMTGALRNLAAEEKMFDKFIDCGVVTELCKTMELFHSDIDIISNIARTLSIISTHDGCCTTIVEYKSIYKIFVVLFEKYPGKEKIIVRLGYMMGNLVAKIDDARINFYSEHNSIECLINVLNIYLQKYLNMGIKKEMANDNDDNIKDASADVIVKIVRIIANASINPDIGKQLIDAYGINLIEIYLMILFTKSVVDNGELVLSVLSTLNNLSYYYKAENENDAFHIKQIDLSKALCSYIDCDNKDCVTEAIRVLGNLSRSKTTRDYIVDKGFFKQLIQLLDKDDLELLRTTMGVFVNLMADNKNRVIFKENEGVVKLIKILQIQGDYDWPLSMLICQVLWNYCIDSMDLYEVFSGNEVEQLLCVLADYLDEEKLFGIVEGEENIEIYSSQEYVLWDEFANVATNLLEKIECFLDNMEPIEITSYSDDEDLCIPEKIDTTSNNISSFSAW